LCSGLLNRCVPYRAPLLSWAATVAPAQALRLGGIDGDRCANAECARLESEAGERHGATPKRLNAHAIRDLTFQNDHSVFHRKPRCSSKVASLMYHSPITIEALTYRVLLRMRQYSSSRASFAQRSFR
jgi:hypothetical protein